MRHLQDRLDIRHMTVKILGTSIRRGTQKLCVYQKWRGTHVPTRADPRLEASDEISLRDYPDDQKSEYRVAGIDTWAFRRRPRTSCNLEGVQSTIEGI